MTNLLSVITFFNHKNPVSSLDWPQIALFARQQWRFAAKIVGKLGHAFGDQIDSAHGGRVHIRQHQLRQFLLGWGKTAPKTAVANPEFAFGQLKVAAMQQALPLLEGSVGNGDTWKMGKI